MVHYCGGVGASLEDDSSEDSDLQEQFVPKKKRKVGDEELDSDNERDSDDELESDDDDDSDDGPPRKRPKTKAAAKKVAARPKTAADVAQRIRKTALADTIRDGKVMPLSELPASVTKPLQLFDVKSSFKAALDALHLKYLVERPDKITDVAEVFRAKAEEYKGHPFMKQIPWETAIESIKEQGAIVESMIADLNDWTLPVNVDDKRQKFDVLQNDFQTALLSLQDYEETIEKLATRERTVAQAEKDKYKHIHHKLYQMAIRHCVPKGIAKVCDEKHLTITIDY